VLAWNKVLEQTYSSRVLLLSFDTRNSRHYEFIVVLIFAFRITMNSIPTIMSKTGGNHAFMHPRVPCMRPLGPNMRFAILFYRDFAPAFVCIFEKSCDDIFSRFSTNQDFDRQTDRQTDRRHVHRNCTCRESSRNNRPNRQSNLPKAASKPDQQCSYP